MEENIQSLVAVIFAAGKGTRMGGDTPKVLLEVGGKPMVYYTLEKIKKLSVKDTFVVVSYQAERVEEEISQFFKVNFVNQEVPLGTANALETALAYIDADKKNVLVLNGDDSAFYSLETLNKFVKSHFETNSVLSFITLRVSDDVKLGRVLRDSQGNFDKILELNEYLTSGNESNEVNCGAYIFNLEWVRKNIGKVERNELKGEYYITELLNIAKNESEKINIFELEDEKEWKSINSPEELEEANKRALGGMD